MRRIHLLRPYQITFILLVLAFGLLAGPLQAVELWVIEQVSVSTNGVLGDNASWVYSLSADGRYVVFASWASNLIDGVVEANRYSADVFVRDRHTGQTTKIGESSHFGIEIEDNHDGLLSADGNYIAYLSNFAEGYGADEIYFWRVVIYDRINQTHQYAPGDLIDLDYDFSADGRCVVYTASYDQAANGGPETEVGDILLYHWQDGTIQRISDPHPADNLRRDYKLPTVSSDCSRVIYWSATYSYSVYDEPVLETVGLYQYDVGSGQTSPIHFPDTTNPLSDQAFPYPNEPYLSDDGRYLATVTYELSTIYLIGNRDGGWRIVVRDLETNQDFVIHYGSETEHRAPRADGSTFSDISSDGRYVAYHIPEEHSYIYDRQTQTSTEIIRPEYATQAPYASSDSLRVRFPTGGQANIIAFDDNFVYSVGDINQETDVFVAPFSPPPPPAPTNLHFTHADGSIQLTWDDIVGESAYHLERSSDGGAGWTEIAQLPADTTQYNDAAIQCSTAYQYRIRAYRADDANYSAYSNIADAAPSDCPNAVPGINVHDTATPTLTWSRVSWAVGYEVEVATDVRFGNVVASGTVGVDPQFTLDPLPEGAYYWRVRGVDANGRAGRWSSAEMFVIELP